MNLDQESLVYFKCVKTEGRLRVRVISPGYANDANCQFPSAIRIENHIYAAPVSALSFARGPAGKFFYRVKSKEVRAVDGMPDQLRPQIHHEAVHVDRVYRATEEGDNDCLICCSADQDVVFVPCGHLCACSDCANRIFIRDKRCPICRTNVVHVCPMDMIQT
jgi:hypothetical protein